MQRDGLRDDQWERERIETLLPGRQDLVGVTAATNRLFIEAVRDRFRVGIPCRELPEYLGDWNNTHRRFSRWAQSGVWQRIFQSRNRC